VNLANCGALTLLPEAATWYRAIQPQHWNTALQTAQTLHIPSRFSEGNGLFEILYLAEDPLVALFEVQALLGSVLPPQLWVPNPSQTWITLNVSVTLGQVADLTRVPQQNLISTNAQELTGDWRGYRVRGPATPVTQPTAVAAPTQELGEALYNVPGIEAFRAVSAKVPTHRVLAIFPQKLRKGSQITFSHPPTNRSRVISPRQP
jgi:RES domain-containing protein